MRTRTVILAAFCVAAMCVAALDIAALQSDVSPVGVYAVSGTGADGKHYDGFAQIVKTGGVFDIQWETPCGVLGIGRIVLAGDFFSVIFQSPGGLGQGLYRLADGGKWIGAWHGVSEDETYPETLTPTTKTLDELRSGECKPPEPPVQL